jgi:hypothetical protein
MEKNILKGQMIQAVENQIKENKPKCAKETFKRLTAAGHPEDKAKEMIAAMLIAEMHDVLKNQRPFDEKRYEGRLKKLK